MVEMHVSEEPFLVRREPNDDGSFDYWYEGSHIIFGFEDGRSLRARRYVDSPDEASLFFSVDGPSEDDAQTGQAVKWLHDAGVSKVLVFGGSSGSYRPIQQGRSGGPWSRAGDV